MKSLETFENFFNDSELVKLREVLNLFDWKYGHRSYRNSDNCFWEAQLSSLDFFTKTCFDKIQKLTNKKYEIIEVYANGQTKDQDGDFHIDSLGVTDPEELRLRKTFLIYVSPIFKENVDVIGGYTHFKRSQGDILSIEPLFNRAVLFDADIPHLGKAPSVKGIFRISIAYKLKELK